MDIWNWVEKLRADLREAGQEQSARLIDELTAYVCDLEVERAEALLPEVKALSRTLNNPWLEIFVRHWEMRNRVGNQLEGETALADAVSLFELANRDDTQACPQSVCVTQDLASCYANVDGPGWVEERIEVCDETLARIDPTWACFHCLSNEKAEALLDDGRGEDALAFLAEQEKKILAAGEEVFDSLLEMRVAILLNLGRAEQALALIGEMEEKVEGAEWNNISQPRRLYKAHGLALLGRDEEALEALLPFSEIARATVRSGCAPSTCCCNGPLSATPGTSAGACSRCSNTTRRRARTGWSSMLPARPSASRCNAVRYGAPGATWRWPNSMLNSCSAIGAPASCSPG